MKALEAPRHRLLLVKVDKPLAHGTNLYDAARAAPSRRRLLTRRR